jgi:hypothetical protein
MTDWQPIETAPRDGTLVCVGWKGPRDTEMQEWFTMQWGHIQKNDLFAPGQIGMWVMPDGSLTWTESTGGGPTHWRPLLADSEG